MFKKFILSVAFVWSLSLSAQAVQFTKGAKLEFWAPSSGATDCHVPFKNLSGADANIVYQKVSVDWPIQWDVSFCDELNCFVNFVVADTFKKLSANYETELKIGVIPNGHADTGVVVYEMFAASNPSVRDTFSANIYVQWGASAPGTSKPRVSVFPNPATDNLTLVSEVSGTAELKDLNGNTVGRFEVGKGFNHFDMSKLSSGIYALTLSTSGGVSSQKIIKN